LAALSVANEDADGILVVTPSDHVIAKEARFLEMIGQAGEVTASGWLVLLGIAPAKPHTRYGYSQRRTLRSFSTDAFKVEAFTEKPNLATAER
jgi:mannose-1-phosphate guanylyltransferase / mannose-6-phosphate isomerase